MLVAAQKKHAYGLAFDPDTDDAQIERHCLRMGGRWQDERTGQMLGNGLLFHFKRYWQLLWPADSQNEWTDMILENVLAHQFTSLVGPASSWKSGTIARLAVMDWSCYPDCTSIIMSSTDMEGLRSRVYAEVTMVWSRAHELYDWFPGFPVDSKCVITNTDVDEDKARDLRNSIVGVPCKNSSGTFIGMGKYCFLPSQPVETPHGPVPISKLKRGDVVNTATGPAVVENSFSRITDSLCRVHFKNGSFVDCTTDHPFLTSLGWVKAVDLLPNHDLISPHEAMSVLQDSNAQLSSESEVLFRGVRDGKLFQKLQGVRTPFCSERHKSNFLYTLLRSEMENEAAGDCRENDSREGFGSRWKGYQRGYSGQQKGNGEKGWHWSSSITPPTNLLQSHAYANARRTSPAVFVPGSSMGIHCKNWQERKAWEHQLLPAGHLVADFEAGRGGRWIQPYPLRPEGKRPTTDQLLKAPRVDRVTLHKPGDKISPAKSEGGYRVHSIEVNGHPSYVVNGCVVHNSGRKNRRVWCIGEEYQYMSASILQAQDNLISNSDGLNPMHGFYPSNYQDPQERGLPRRGYKAVFVGNTNPSVPDNPLDILSEPEGGWGSVPQATETVGITQVWKCKKHPKHPIQCYCINLDSLDSPNSKHPIDKPRWAHMAGPHKLTSYTVGSESYWSNGRGIFKFGLAEFKVITREVCEQFHAMDPLIWDGGSELTNIGMCDAAYGGTGGDRCPIGWLQFGKCLDGVTRVLMKEFWLCPVTIQKGIIPEDQIAAFARDKMETVNVLPENFFFDGRGSLAMSFARLWSPKVNAIEFGGPCTERAAGPDMFIVDEKGVRRLKKAKEHYRKFVTELMWSWRYAIESDQIRGLTLDIILDAQPREWRKVAGDKIEIETKREMRLRTGISPDLADMFETGLEGARRRGFQIAKLSNPKADPKRGKDWLEKFAQDYERLLKSKELQSVA